MILILLACLLAGFAGDSLAEKRFHFLSVSPRRLLVYVDEPRLAAKANHETAEAICRNIFRVRARQTLAAAYQLEFGAEHLKKFGRRLSPTDFLPQWRRSSLLSVATPDLLSTIVMPWLMQRTQEGFWIGMKVDKETMGKSHIDLVQPRWTDGSPVSFVNFAPDATGALAGVADGTTLCTSVDHADGKWGVNKCSARMNFMCQIEVEPPVEPSSTAASATTAAPPATVDSSSPASAAVASTPAAPSTAAAATETAATVTRDSVATSASPDSAVTPSTYLPVGVPSTNLPAAPSTDLPAATVDATDSPVTMPASTTFADSIQMHPDNGHL